MHLIGSAEIKRSESEVDASEYGLEIYRITLKADQNGVAHYKQSSRSPVMYLGG